MALLCLSRYVFGNVNLSSRKNFRYFHRFKRSGCVPLYALKKPSYTGCSEKYIFLEAFSL